MRATGTRSEIFPVEALRQAAALGFGGIYVKEDVGGSALTRLDAALIFEELAQGCTSTAAYISIHNMAAWMIDAFGGDAAAQEISAQALQHGTFRQLLPDRAGRRLRCREPHHARAPRRRHLRARRQQGLHFRRRRFRHLCGDGAHRRGAARAEFPRIVVEKGTPGLTFGAPEKKLGWKSQPTAMVNFENCRVPVANLIGREGQGFRIAMAGLDGGRLNIGACSLGGAQFCLDRTIEYMKERKQFGSRLADFQALQFRIADYATEIEAARLLLHRAAVAVSAGEPAATRLAAQAKRLATDTGFDVVNGCLQLHGGYGYLRDHPIERVLRDVRVHQILEGTNEIMRLIVSRAMLGN